MRSEESGAYRFVHEVEVRFRDLDPMGHAHHTMPLVYFEEARAAYWRKVAGRFDLGGIDYILAEVRLLYHARITFPATLQVAVRVSAMGGKSFTMDYEARSADGELLAAGTTVQVMYDYAAAAPKPIPDELRGWIEAFERGEQEGTGLQPSSRLTATRTKPMNPPST